MIDLNVLDLFSGAGGLSNGFEQAGFSVIGGLDSNDAAIETWNHNHDEGEGLSIDLTDYTPNDVLKKLGYTKDDIDVIVGGPPCQDFTKCNRMIDLGRNNLVLLYGEYVETLQPKAFVMENVRQLLTVHSDVLESFCDKLEDEYVISYRTLDSADYGVPQHRLRAFVVGIRKDAIQSGEQPQFPAPTHGPDSPTEEKDIRTAGEALQGLSPPQNPSAYKSGSKHAHLLDDIPPGMNYTFYTTKMGHPEPEFEWRSKFSDYLYKADPKKPVKTLKASPGAASGPFHWENRRFTEEELKRLQSFPDSFNFPQGYTNVVTQIGNSVPPMQAKVIAMAVSKQLGTGYDDLALIEADTDLDFFSRKRTPSAEYRRKAHDRLKELGYEPVTEEDET